MDASPLSTDDPLESVGDDLLLVGEGVGEIVGTGVGDVVGAGVGKGLVGLALGDSVTGLWLGESVLEELGIN